MRKKLYTTSAERDLEARRRFRNADTAQATEWTEGWKEAQRRLSQLTGDETPPCLNCSSLVVYLCATEPVPCREFRAYTGVK